MHTIIAFVVTFGVIVFFHELGHLYFAKRAGILCREFAIGFGPKVFSFMKNETVYAIRLLPLGGFVRMAGAEDEMFEVKPGSQIGLVLDESQTVTKIITDHFEKHQDLLLLDVESVDLDHQLEITGYESGSEELRTYRVSEKAMYVEAGQAFQIAPYNRQFGSKSLGARTMAILAGPMMNFLLAIVIMMVLGLIQGMPVDRAEIGDTVAGSVAESAGLQKGDKIISIDNKPVETWQDLVTTIQQYPDVEVTMEVERNAEKMEVKITPEAGESEMGTVGRIGVYPPVERSIIGSITSGFTRTFDFTRQMLIGVSQLITGRIPLDNLSGPVGIFQMTGAVAETGFTSSLQWAAILSINLGIMNLLPLPASDGGKLIFFAVEAVRGKPMDPKKEGIIHFIGFALLMLLMLVVTWNDIRNFF